MARNKNNSQRLNIYIHEPGIRRQIKAMAAQKEVSLSEYCLQAILRQLAEEERIPRGRRKDPLKSAIAKANRFRTGAFGKKVFLISSADLIQESRESRTIP
jgi:hypothetical protein